MTKAKSEKPETVDASGDAGVMRVVVQNDAMARQQFAADLAALKQHPIDRTQAGGYYLNADGTAHDAEGRPIPVRRAAATADDADA
jgi:hypothetical protein